MPRRWSATDALERAGRRRNRWRLLLLPVGFVCIAAVFVLGALATLHAQMAFAPDEAFFCTPARVAMVLLMLALIVWSVPTGLLLANALVWLAPPARRGLERADGRAGLSFVRSNRLLIRAIIFAAVLAVPLYVVALPWMGCVSNAALSYRAHPFAKMISYEWSEVRTVRLRCEHGSRGGWNFGFAPVTPTGAEVELATVSPWFTKNAQHVVRSTVTVPRELVAVDSECPAGFRQLIGLERGR